MQVERCSGQTDLADVLERIFEGGIVIDPYDRMSLAPGLSLIEESETLRAEAESLLSWRRELRSTMRAQRHAFRSKVAELRKARLSAAGTAFDIITAPRALEQARRKAA